MIGYLLGEVLEHQDGKMLVGIGNRENSGTIGYAVTVPQSAEYGGIQVGQKAELFVYTHVREDSLDLYGFSSKLEKNLFLVLLGVSGIGPKSALGILSAAEPVQLMNAIVEGDQAFLNQIPGIGKKTAERVIVELRDSIRKKMETGVWQGLKAAKTSKALGGASSVFQDAEAALLSLGYREQDVQMLLKQMSQTMENVPKRAEDLIRAALRQLA